MSKLSDLMYDRYHAWYDKAVGGRRPSTNDRLAHIPQHIMFYHAGVSEGYSEKVTIVGGAEKTKT